MSLSMLLLAVTTVLFFVAQAQANGDKAVHTIDKSQYKGKKNVLFIVSDDFRPSLGVYGLNYSHTPNLDKLAEEGITFMAAHVQFSYCAPSRNSFMSGRRPDTNKVWNFNNHFREPECGGDKWTALPEHFKNNGYLVSGGGKIFHPGVPPNFDQPRSWSGTSPDGAKWEYDDGPKPGPNASTKCDHSDADTFYDDHLFCLTEDQNDKPPHERGYLLDEAVTNEVIGRLNVAMDNWKTTGQPFFMALGTHRPHLTWQYPKRFYDQIPSEIPEATHKFWPADVPHLGFHECAEMSVNYLDTNGLGTAFTNTSFDGHQAQMRRAYYGCLSYADDLIGQALAALEAGGAKDDTVVSFIGDHGWHLGEHDMWCKMSTLELGTRIPMIFRAPWINTAVGVKTLALAEAVDLYPTLSELAGLELPTGLGGQYLGGVSLVPVFHDPQHGSVKNATLSQFPRCWQNNTHYEGNKGPGDENNKTVSWESMSDCHWTDREHLDFMGYKMRTHNMSITRWLKWNGTSLKPDWNSPVGTELYLHAGDDGMAPAAFDDYENKNLAGDPAFEEIQAAMLGQLRRLAEQWMTPLVNTTAILAN